MRTIILVTFLGGLGLVLMFVLVIRIIFAYRDIPAYLPEQVYEEYHKKVYRNGSRWKNTLYVLIFVDIFCWWFLKDHFSLVVVGMLIGLNILLVLDAIGDYQQVRLLTKRFRELEAEHQMMASSEREPE